MGSAQRGETRFASEDLDREVSLTGQQAGEREVDSSVDDRPTTPWR